MIIRKIRKDDLNERNIISSVCFERPYSLRTPIELYEEYSKPTSRIEENWNNRWCAFLDDGETMISSLGSFPYNMYFDGNKVKVGAISGVVTMPQYRKQGAVRECLKNAFREMYEQGIPFSYLYPFSTKYYNKFGYESVTKKVVWTLPISSIKETDIRGAVKFYQPSDDISDLKTIYNSCMSDCNYAIVRNNLDWELLTKTFDLDNTPQFFTYSFTNHSGTPKAFITFTKDVDEFNRKLMDCKNFFCVDFEGFCGILQFVKNFSANYDAVRFALPEFFRPEKAFNEFEIDYKYMISSFHGMARIVDVEKVLKLAKYNGSGKVTISLNDSYCPWNEGVYEIVFSQGNLITLKKLPNDADIDAQMRINDFTALISGRYSSDDFEYLPELIVHGNIENLSKVFYRKKIFIWDFF